VNGRRKREYRRALDQMRDWARTAAGPDWTEEQWRGLLDRAVSQPPEPARGRRVPLWRPVLAAASMLAALAAGSWYMALGPGSTSASRPDSRAGEMLPADPAVLVAPGRAAATEPATESPRLVPRWPEIPPSWIYLGPGPGAPVFTFLPSAVSR